MVSYHPWVSLKRVPFIVWIYLLQAAILVNAEVIAPPGMVDRFRTIIITYMLMQMVFLRVAPRVPGLRMNLNAALIYFVGAFVVTTFVLAGLRAIPQVGLQAYAVAAPMFLIILHASVVAVAEELIFRGALPLVITVIPAQFSFGLFHFAAYGGDWMMILMAITAGFIFYGIMRFTRNIWAPIGVHLAINLYALGIF